MKLPAAQAVARIASMTTTSSARKTALSSNTLSSTRSTQIISRQFRRTYADAPPVAPAQPVKKRKLRVFRWLWRLTYVSLLGSVAYVVYDGYAARHPDDQFTPDPAKKTLVVLGKYIYLPIGEPMALGSAVQKRGLTCGSENKVPVGAQLLS
jgi:NADH:ubiquinone reductase (non-electrogenic)